MRGMSSSVARPRRPLQRLPMAGLGVTFFPLLVRHMVDFWVDSDFLGGMLLTGLTVACSSSAALWTGGYFWVCVCDDCPANNDGLLHLGPSHAPLSGPHGYLDIAACVAAFTGCMTGYHG